MQAFFKDVATQFWTLIKPPKKDGYFSWQTLLLLSLFSILVAAALDALEPESQPFSVDVLSTLSWIFFTVAIWWALGKNEPIKIGNFSLSPWITGAILCVFVFQPGTPTRFRWALSSWPIISTLIKALPHLVGWDLELKYKKIKDKDLQELIMTTLITLLMSSWIVFHFRVQDWVNNYPSLLVNGLDRSAFVYDFAWEDRKEQSQPQGVPLLEGTADAIAAELNGLPWYQTERWLFNRQEKMEAISTRMLNTLYSPEEQIFWRMVVPVPRRLGEGYLLTLRANWLGPVAQDDGFYLEKTCKITPEDKVRPVPVEKDQPPPTSKLTVVSCDEVPPTVKWIKSGTSPAGPAPSTTAPSPTAP